MTPLIEIMQLNQNRYGMQFNYQSAMDKLSEELSEFTEANANSNTHETADALADIIVVAAGELTKLGFNPQLVLKETLKEISSRRQDKQQAIEWANSGKSGKWEKDRNQDPSTLHTANYNLCKI